MIREENWAVPVGRIRKFFRTQPDVTEWDGAFYWHSCRVCVGAAEHTPLGSLQIPRTLIEMTGEEADVDALHRRFFLRFLSAGG